MNQLQEKRSLVELARKFGQEPAAELLAEIAALERDEQQRLDREAAIRERVAQDLTELFNLEVKKHELVQPQTAEISEQGETHARPVATPDTHAPSPAAAPTIAQRVAQVISESGVVAPDPVLARPQKNLEAEIRRLEQWISRIAATGPGGGEVNLRWLDDVDRSNITDGQYLRYDAPTKKFTFDAGDHNQYHLQVQSRLTQTSSATSANAMTFEITDFAYGLSIDGGNSSQIVVANPGVYNLQFSVQLYNVGNSPDIVHIWFTQNGSNIENSNSIVTVPAKDNANTPGAVIAGWNFAFSTATPNEYIQIKWFVGDETHVYIAGVSSQAATATTPYIPAVPSIIATVTPIKIDSY